MKIQQGSRWLFYVIATISSMLFLISGYQAYYWLGYLSWHFIISAYISIPFLLVSILSYRKLYPLSVLLAAIYLSLSFSAMITAITQQWIFNLLYLPGQLYGALSIILGLLFLVSLKQRVSFKR